MNSQKTVVRRFKAAKLDRYIYKAQDRVVGWLHIKDAEVIRLLGDVQTAKGITGAVGEIGVYEGRLFHLLGLLTHEGEDAFALDPFTGTSYRGEEPNLETKKIERIERRFLKFFERFCGEDVSLTLIKEPSETFSLSRFRQITKPFRLFSVDGNHEASSVAHDMALAEATLSQGGIIFADDVFNAIYPAVSNGIHEFFKKKRKLVPFFIGMNKVCFCRPDFAAGYKAAIQEDENIPIWGETLYFGHPTLLIDKEIISPKLFPKD